MKNFLVLFILSCLLMGCRKPDSNPELRDPIYQSIQAKAKEAEANFAAAQKEVETNTKGIEEIKAQTREGGIAWTKFHTSKRKLVKAKQMLDFYNLHLINRKYAARNSYIRYFNLNKESEWPDPGQKYRYDTQERLKNAPLEWNSFDIATQINEM